jgi:hypothetical protein
VTAVANLPPLAEPEPEIERPFREPMRVPEDPANTPLFASVLTLPWEQQTPPWEPTGDPAMGGQGERKQVTVLFADVKGSLALIEHADPEDAGESWMRRSAR